MPYTLTVNIAEPGTPLKDGHTSYAGHMWYSISDGKTSNNYGFAPVKPGDTSGPGHVSTKDNEEYKSTYYKRTLEISKDQYDKLKSFGDAAIKKDEKLFKLEYNGLNHSCVDFTWAALNHADIHTNKKLPAMVGIDMADKNYEGSLKPTRNMEDIQRIKAPLTKSQLNKEDFTPMEAGSKQWLQRLLSEEQKAASPDLASTQTPDVSANSKQIIHQRIMENLRNNPDFLAARTENNLSDDKSQGLQPG